MSVNQGAGAIMFDCFTIEQVKEINKVIRKNISQNPPRPNQQEDVSSSAKNLNKIGKFSYVDCGPLMELLHPWLYKCQLVNRNYYSYDINWDFHIEVLCYNLYGIGGKYEWHIDSNKTEGPSPKLTCLLNLSEEPYEGGDLHIVGKNEKQKFNSSGSSIVFTSLLSHKVTPVTKGERITLTYWGEGPAWR